MGDRNVVTDVEPLPDKWNLQTIAYVANRGIKGHMRQENSLSFTGLTM